MDSIQCNRQISIEFEQFTSLPTLNNFVYCLLSIFFFLLFVYTVNQSVVVATFTGVFVIECKAFFFLFALLLVMLLLLLFFLFSFCFMEMFCLWNECKRKIHLENGLNEMLARNRISDTLHHIGI